MTDPRKFHTVLLAFDPHTQQPAYRPGMKILGGQLVAVAFDDLMQRIDDLELVIEEREQTLSSANDRLRMMDEILDAVTGRFAEIGIPEPAEGFRERPRDILSALNDLNTRFRIVPKGPADEDPE